MKKHAVFRGLCFAFGVIMALTFSELVLRVAGTAFLARQGHKNQLNLKERHRIRILCLGESTTNTGWEPSYPTLLQNVLNQRAGGDRFVVINGGVPGTTTSDILAHLDENLLKYRPHIVIAMMGVNDREHIKPVLETSQGKKRLLVAKFIRLLWLNLSTPVRAHFIHEKVADVDFPSGPAEVFDLSVGDAAKMEKDLRREVRIFPKGSRESKAAQLKLAGVLLRLGKRPEALEIVNNVTKGGFDDDQELIAHAAHVQRAMGNWEESADLFKQDSAGGAASQPQQQPAGREREAIVTKALETGPPTAELLEELIWIYTSEGKAKQAEETFQKAVDLNLVNRNIKVGMAEAYYQTGDWSKAREIHETLTFQAGNDNDVFFSAAFYIQTGNPEKAERILRAAIRTFPDFDMIFAALATALMAQGRHQEAETFYVRAGQIREQNPVPSVLSNYPRLLHRLRENGIPLVCVQYPVRSSSPLRKILNDDEVVIVSNKKVFKEALRKYGVMEIFTDVFGGDFGHCTPLGYRILAENIADALLKTVLKDAELS